jgi:diadenosine tetraphosphate (Ap4A) HIT family hydrolase
VGETTDQLYQRAVAAAEAAGGRLPLPPVTEWDTFPFDGDLRVRALEPPAQEPARGGETTGDCHACMRADEEFLWSDVHWRLGHLKAPSGLPVVVVLFSRAHLDLGDLPDDLAAELGVLTVRVERAVRAVDDIVRVHVGRWGDGGAHLHVWFMGRPTGLLQLRGSFAAIWDDILPPLPQEVWREHLATVARGLAQGGGTAHV